MSNPAIPPTRAPMPAQTAAPSGPPTRKPSPGQRAAAGAKPDLCSSSERWTPIRLLSPGQLDVVVDRLVTPRGLRQALGAAEVHCVCPALTLLQERLILRGGHEGNIGRI